MSMANTVLSLGLVMSLASAAVAYTPLTDQRYNYPSGLPYKVDNDATGRGPQFGYNICNSTTENQNSNCQTAILNSIDDFCIWGPADPNSLIANEEAKTVSWCTKPGHGSRTIPAGTLTGIQVLKAPGYILFTGHLKQELINIQTGDEGGELDPHGDDQRGNPLGGLVYTNGFASSGGNANSYTQVIEWHNFLGSDIFCFKICDPSVPNSQGFCNNIFDRTGCSFVAPAAYPDNVFEVCESDNQDPVGVYTTNGAVSTYKQPPEGVDITSLPSVKTPASSQCTTYTSSVIYAAAASVTPTISVTGTGSSTGSTTGSSTDTNSGASSSGTGTVTSGVKTSTTSGRPSSTTTSTSSTSNAARAGVTVMGEGVIGMGPVIAIAASVLAGLGAVLAGL